MKLRLLLNVLAVFCISACSYDYDSLIEDFIPEEAEQGKNAIQLLIDQNFFILESLMHESIDGPHVYQSLKRLSDLFPDEEPLDVKTVGSQVSISKNIQVLDSPTSIPEDSWEGTFSFQYQFSERWLVASTKLVKEGGGSLKILAMNVELIPDDLEVIHRFSLKSQPLKKYLFFAATCFVPLLVLFSLVWCIRTKNMRMKWLWVFFIIFGISQFTLNWSTNEITSLATVISLFGASFEKGGPYSPLILSIGIPFGAMVFLIYRAIFYSPVEKTEN